MMARSHSLLLVLIVALLSVISSPYELPSLNRVPSRASPFLPSPRLRGGLGAPPSSSSAASVVLTNLRGGASLTDSSSSGASLLSKSLTAALDGGLPGALAGLLQVVTLMWVRTVLNYQYRYGGGLFETMRKLYAEGGVPRFYRGVAFAAVQGPLSKFGSTAANDGVNAWLSSGGGSRQWGPSSRTLVASLCVGVWRIVLMPIDTCKTVLQVDSTVGYRALMRKVCAGQVGLLYQGSVALAVSAMVAHYPWFYCYNYLSVCAWLPPLVPNALLRSALVGFLCSVVSDTCSNAIRVLKTTKQSLATKRVATYREAANAVLAKDGWSGLFGRGLGTRIFANGLQSVMFTVAWKAIKKWLEGRAATRTV